jgi:hypothetical protein
VRAGRLRRGRRAQTGSGLDPASGILKRRSATLTGTTCGTFGAFATVATDPSSPVSSAVSAGACYQYEYLVSDNVGNQATYTSSNTLKVNWPSLTHALSLAGPAGAYLAGSTLYYNSNGAGSFPADSPARCEGDRDVTATSGSRPRSRGQRHHEETHTP